MIRILIGNSPGMVPDGVKALLADQPDMQIVGDAESPMQILQEVESRSVEVVVLATRGDEEPGLCSHLLSTFPDIIVRCVAADLSVAFLQHRRPQRYVIPDTSPHTILTSLRSMMGNS